MANFHAIGQADVLPLLHQIHRQPELWKADTYLRDYPQGPFGDTETIFVRFPPVSVSELEHSKVDQHECIWMEGAAHLPAARQIIFQVMGRVEAERLGRVMINKLRPGGRVFAHADTPVHAQYWDRYHVVLQSSPGCQFRCGEDLVYMPPGQVWHFRNELEHEVINNGSVDRIHMVMDVRCGYFDVKAPLPSDAKAS